MTVDQIQVLVLKMQRLARVRPRAAAVVVRLVDLLLSKQKGGA